MSSPLVSLIVTTFERPRSLHLVLSSLEHQIGLAARDMEIIVADDGSQDETKSVVDDFRTKSRFNVLFTTHPHDGFQAACTRNDGVRASCAPYLVFLDGDCVAAPNHVEQHLKLRRPRTAMAGFCYHLDAITSARIDDSALGTGAYQQWVSPEMKKKLDRMDWKARFYAIVPHPRRPKLYSGDFGIWRSDYEAVNGFNEEFTGWGCEDDDFGIRVLRSGVRVRSILRWTRTYHLWHPPVPSNPQRWRDGSNVDRLKRDTRGSSARCVRGLRTLSEVA